MVDRIVFILVVTISGLVIRKIIRRMQEKKKERFKRKMEEFDRYLENKRW